MQKVSGGKVVAPATDSESALPAEVIRTHESITAVVGRGLIS